MEEAYSGESRQVGALEKAVHGDGLRRGGGARGGLEAEAQRLGKRAKWVGGWPEELVAEGIGKWWGGVHELGSEAGVAGAACLLAH